MILCKAQHNHFQSVAGHVIAAGESSFLGQKGLHLEAGPTLEEMGSPGKRPALPFLLQGSASWCHAFACQD